MDLRLDWGRRSQLALPTEGGPQERGALGVPLLRQLLATLPAVEDLREERARRAAASAARMVLLRLVPFLHLRGARGR